MSASPLSSRRDGRIDLDQQRKRAKALLRRLRQGDAPDQLALVATRQPAQAPRLSDAQWLVARELGFASWPKLKAHADAIAFAARHPDFAATDEQSTQHWRCGNDIAHSLRVAGFKGAFHMLSDPLCMGPVPALTGARYQALRSDYIAQAFASERGEAARRLDDEYAALARMDDSARIVLWCEADAYDQLFLIRVLAGLERLPQRLELIEVGGVPGIDRFIGIGQLAPDVLAWLWPQRRSLGEDALHLARRAWAAYCAPAPRDWALLAHGQTPELPLLAPALLRQLRELPALGDGLSLTERLSLEILKAFGQLPCGRVFAELDQRFEPLPYLGDLMFHALLRPLIDAPEPLILEIEPQRDWPQRPLALTALGRRVLEGRAYWLDHAVRERWVGGVRIRPGHAHWALDERARPVWRD